MKPECWWKLECHFCKCFNWILDTNNLIVEEDFMNAVNCWKCDKLFWFMQTTFEDFSNMYRAVGSPSKDNQVVLPGLARPRFCKPRPIRQRDRHCC